MKYIVAFISSIIFSLYIYAQENIKDITGFVVDEDKCGLNGALINAFSNDSVLLATTQTDSIGKFSIKCPIQDVRLIVSLIGYEKRYVSVNIKNNKPLTMMLKPYINMMDEVIVEGREMVKKGDKLILYPSTKIKKNAYDGYSALNLMSISGLEVDMFDQTVTTHGKATTLCINGRKACADEIATLAPEDIKRIDYYQTFNPNHPDAQAVVDFILKNRDNGGILFAKANHRLNIAKGDGKVDFKQYNGKSEFNVQLSGSYDRYSPNKGNESVTYMPFDGHNDMTKSVVTLPSSERNNATSAKVAYFYKNATKTRNNLFNITAMLQKKHSINGRNMTEAYNNAPELSAIDCRHKDNLSPSVKLYFETSTKKSRFTSSINGSYNEADNERYYKSLNPIYATTDQKYKYLSTNFYYSHNIGKHHVPFIQLASKHDWIKTNYVEDDKLTYTNMSDNDVALYVGDRFEAIPNRLYFTLNIFGRFFSVNDEANGRNTKTVINPALFCNAMLSEKNSLNIVFGRSVDEPDFSLYNDVEQTIDQYQSIKGNPNLQICDAYMAHVNFLHNAAWGSVDANVQYMYADSPIYNVVYRNVNRYVQSYVNADGMSMLKSSASITLNLIKKTLKWKGGVNYNYYENSLEGASSCNSLYFNSSLTYLANKFSAKAEVSTSSKAMFGGAVMRNPLIFRLSMAYTYRKWHFTLDAKNPFVKTWYGKDYAYRGYETHYRMYGSYNYYDVISLGANYRINYGKKHKFQSVEMDEGIKSAILEH